LENLEMKKTLVAIAALAAFGAQAQSTVSITGTIDPHYQISKTTFADGSKRSATEMVSSNVGTSNVTFSGTEDLGGGLKGLFLYEMDFDTTVSGTGPTAGGQIYAGVSTPMGTVKLGVPNTPSLTTQGSRSGFGTKIGGGRSGMGLSGASRTRNSDSILFESADYSGFSAKFAHTAKATAGDATIYGTGAVTAAEEISDLGLFYKAGAIDAGLSQYNQKGAGKHTTAFASYTMGAIKLIGGMHTYNNEKAQTTDADGSSTAAAKLQAGLGKSTGKNIGATYTMGATTLMANVARTNDKTSVDRDLSLNAVGVKYELSKRTSLNARFISEKRKNITTNNGDIVPQAVKTTLLGIQHNF
jgi:predicted porin